MCYVCLEECDTKSPCRCGQPLHCLMELQNTDNRCTICKSRFDLTIQIPQRDNDDGVSEWVDMLTLVPAALFWSFCFYVLSGYCGFLLPFWNSDWSEFFIFWTVEHLLCCIGFTVLMNIVVQVYALLRDTGDF